MLRTNSTLPLNLDRKLVTTLLTGSVVYLLVTVLGLEVSEDVKAAVATVVAAVVGWVVPPSDVESA